MNNPSLFCLTTNSLKVYQNHLLAGAWVLISGLQAQFTTNTTSVVEKTPHGREREDKGRSPSKSRESTSARSGLSKFQQSFGVLSVALASKALSLLTELFEDLHLEMCSVGGGVVQVSEHNFEVGRILKFLY